MLELEQYFHETIVEITKKKGIAEEPMVQKLVMHRQKNLRSKRSGTIRE